MHGASLSSGAPASAVLTAQNFGFCALPREAGPRVAIEKFVNGMKPRRTWFSRHAVERVSERLTISHAEVAQLLDDGLTLRIGEQERTNRQYLLFYSAADGRCFVAIQNAVNGTLVTVLPIRYYEKMCGKISWGNLKRARKMVLERAPRKPSRTPEPYRSPEPEPVTAPPPSPAAPAAPAVTYRVLAYVATVDGRVKIASLGSWKASATDDPSTTVADREFAAALQQRLEARGVLQDALTIVLERPKAGVAVSFNLESIFDFATAA